MKTKICISIIVLLAVALLYSYIPIRVKQPVWNSEDLLSRPIAEYTDEALAKVNEPERHQLIVEKVRSDYYGFLAKKDFHQAYEILSPKVRQVVDEKTFQQDIMGFISGSEKYLQTGWIQNIRILREFGITTPSDSKAKAAIVAISVNSAAGKKTGPAQTFVFLDVWTSDDGDIYVIPCNYAALSVTGLQMIPKKVNYN